MTVPLYPRLTGKSLPDLFKEAESVPPLNYEKQGRTTDLAFWHLPERLLDEPDELVAPGAKASGTKAWRAMGRLTQFQAMAFKPDCYTTFFARNAAISAAPYPSSASTESVCSPASGVALRTDQGVRLSSIA